MKELLKTLIDETFFGHRVDKDIDQITDHLEKMFDYNFSGGKGLREKFFRLLISTMDHGQSREILDSLELCLEVLQACCLMADDIVDQSPTRRGKPSWYTIVGQQAINDIGILRETANLILHRFLSGHKNYTSICELFSEATRIGYCGQILDMITSSKVHNHSDFLSEFTVERYDMIMRMKGGFTTFVVPFKLALLVSGKNDPIALRAVQELGVRLGALHGLNDDFIDVLGNEAKTGKHGTDIVNGKCTWFIVTALGLATEEQRRRLLTNYGRDNEKSVEVVKQIYYELDLLSWYRKAEQKLADKIRNDIEKISSEFGLNPKPSFELMKMLLYREK